MCIRDSAAVAAAAALPWKPSRIHALFGGLPVFLARAAADAMGVPFSASVHAADVYLAARHYSALLKEADFIVGCNRCVLDCLAVSVPELADRCRLLHHGYAAGDSIPVSPAMPDSGELKLLAVGRFVAKKGFHVLVEALKVLNDGGINARLVLAGDGPDDRPRRLAEQLGIADRVKFTGWVRGGVGEALHLYGPFHALVVRRLLTALATATASPTFCSKRGLTASRWSLPVRAALPKSPLTARMPFLSRPAIRPPLRLRPPGF